MPCNPGYPGDNRPASVEKLVRLDQMKVHTRCPLVRILTETETLTTYEDVAALSF